MSTNESLHTFRTMVSQVFRLTMAVTHGEGNNAIHNFDQFLDTAMNVILSNESNKQIQNELSYEASKNLTSVLLERDNKVCTLFEPSPVASPRPFHASSPTLVIHPESNVDVIVTKEEPVVKNEFKNVCVNSAVPSVVKATVIASKQASDVIGIVEDNDTVMVDAEEDANDNEVEAEDEEEVEAEDEEEEEVEVEAEDEEEEEVEVEEDEEEEEVEVEAEDEEEEVEVEAEDEEEVEVEAEDEEEEVEVEAEEDEEEEMEVVKIGKKNYFVGETSKMVYVYVNDEEAGDCLGKYVDGKIVPAA